MDTLALLCNLHADGPETLQRLRSAGWDTLREIQAVDLLELERVLDSDRGRAVRFQREAGLLRERLGGEIEMPAVIDERAGSASASPAGASPADGAEPAQPAAALPSSPRRAPEPAPPSSSSTARTAKSEEPTRRPFAMARLSSWSEAPRPRASAALNAAPNAAPNAASNAASSGELEDVNELALSPDRPIDRESELERPARDVLIPRPAVLPAMTPAAPVNPTPPSAEWQQAAEVRKQRLAVGAVDGLDAETARKLAAAGVASLDALSEAAALELSTESGLEYTSLLRLQFLARRALANRPKLQATTQPSPRAPRPSATPPPRRERDAARDEDDDVAGPFA